MAQHMVCLAEHSMGTLNLFIYLFIFAVLGLRFCARALSSCGKRGPLFIAVHGPLTVTAPPVVGHRLQTCRLSSCGSRAQSMGTLKECAFCCCWIECPINVKLVDNWFKSVLLVVLYTCSIN